MVYGVPRVPNWVNPRPGQQIIPKIGQISLFKSISIQFFQFEIQFQICSIQFQINGGLSHPT